jgi:hypothetical protein
MRVDFEACDPFSKSRDAGNVVSKYTVKVGCSMRMRVRMRWDG